MRGTLKICIDRDSDVIAKMIIFYPAACTVSSIARALNLRPGLDGKPTRDRCSWAPVSWRRSNGLAIVPNRTRRLIATVLRRLVRNGFLVRQKIGRRMFYGFPTSILFDPPPTIQGQQ